MYLDPEETIKKKLKCKNYNNQIKALLYVRRCVIKMSFSKSTLQNFMQKDYSTGSQKGKKFHFFCYQNPQKSTFTTSKHIRKQSVKTGKHPQVNFFSFKKV